MKAITRQKPFEEIKELLAKLDRPFIVGCGTCTTMTKTGGIEQVLEMKDRLRESGKLGTGWTVIPTACDEMTEVAMKENAQAIQSADCILSMACALGVHRMSLYLNRPITGALVGRQPFGGFKLSGIGSNMETRLLKHVIRTMADLYAQTPEQLRSVWGGVGGERFHARLRGAEVHDVDHGMGSIGHSHVLAPDLRNRDDAYSVLNRLTQKAAMRLRKTGYYTGRIAIKVKFLNGPSWEKETRFLETQDTLDLLHALDQLWPGYPKKKQLTPLQVGIVLTDLTSEAAQSARLFDDLEQTGDKKKLNAAIDLLNTRFGKKAAYFGGAHRALDHGKLAIAFNHIPDVETEK